MPAYLPGSLDEFLDHVVPKLQRSGLFRLDYEIRPDLPKGTPLLPKEFPPSIWPPARRESAEGISA